MVSSNTLWVFHRERCKLICSYQVCHTFLLVGFEHQTFDFSDAVDTLFMLQNFRMSIGIQKNIKL